MQEKWVVGIDLGGTTVKIAFLTIDGSMIDNWEIPTDNSNEGANITGDIAKSINEKQHHLLAHLQHLLDQIHPLQKGCHCLGEFSANCC